MNTGRWWLALMLVGCGTNAPPDPAPKSVGRLELTCPQHSVLAYDPSRSVLTGPTIACTARVADATGAPLAGVQVQLLAEAGRLIGGTSNSEGIIELTHEVALPAPLDVEPGNSRASVLTDALHTGQPIAPSWMRPQDWGTKPAAFFPNQVAGVEPSRPDSIRVTDTGRRVNNPRDNLVTLVAWVDGAEMFNDANANGTLDPGEMFTDLTEPFVDANDDGTWNQGEAFVDTNGNRQWDGKNLAFDATTKLWVQERVLWTGLPAWQDVALTLQGVTGQVPTFRARAPNLVCLRDPCESAFEENTNHPGGVAQIYMADPWLNAMTRAAPGGCVITPELGAALVRYGPVMFALEDDADVPDGLLATFEVSDVRDPASPQTNRPRGFPQPYVGRITCEVSDGSPTGHASVSLPFSGTIE